MAAELGVVEALLGMAGWYMTGIDDDVKDVDVAVGMVRKAVEMGSARAEYTLGMCGFM